MCRRQPIRWSIKLVPSRTPTTSALRTAPSRCLSRPIFLRSKQLLHFVPFQSFRKRFLSGQGCLNEFALSFLQFEDLFFHGISRDQFVARDYPGLPNPMSTIGSLRFHRRVPP